MKPTFSATRVRAVTSTGHLHGEPCAWQLHALRPGRGQVRCLRRPVGPLPDCAIRLGQGTPRRSACGSGTRAAFLQVASNEGDSPHVVLLFTQDPAFTTG